MTQAEKAGRRVASARLIECGVTENLGAADHQRGGAAQVERPVGAGIKSHAQRAADGMSATILVENTVAEFPDKLVSTDGKRGGVAQNVRAIRADATGHGQGIGGVAAA